MLEMALPVRPGERRLTLALFLHSLCAVGAFITGRTVRDALFLAHADGSQLAWMYVASAVAVTAAGLAYGPIAARVRRDRVALASALLFAALFLLAWFVERRGHGWVYAALYVFVEVMGAIVLVQFWTLANELFNAREAKRLYGLIGAGGTVANVVVGYASGKIASWFGASALLWVCAVLLAGTAAAAFSGGRLGRGRLFAKQAGARGPTPSRSGGAMRVLTSTHLRAVALLSAITFFTTTLVDFEFKVTASAVYSRDALAAYFGYFSAVVGVLALVLQLFGTGKLLNRAGVIGALAVLPASLALGNLGLLFLPGLWAASLTKGADTLFRYSVNDATTQILYLPVPPQARAAAKAFIDGVVKPLAIGAGGLALAAYRSVAPDSPHQLGWVALALCGVWLAVVASLRSKYIRSLQDNLRNRRLDLESARHKVLDGSTNAVLQRALESGDPREVLNALELLPHFDNLALDHRVEALLEHPVAEVRISALAYYGRRKTMRFANSIFRRFEDPDPRVRAAAIDAFCAIGRDKAVRSVRPFLSDDDPAIRSAAVIGMIRYGGLDGVLMAAEALKALIDHADERMREHAAKVLGAIGVQNFYQPVLQMMNDGAPSVRRQAIQAAGELRSPEFVLPLIYKTQSMETFRDAVEALTAYGPSILPTLAKVLSNGLENPLVRRGVARVLGRLATPEAVAAISGHLDAPDEELRTTLYRALARAAKGGVPLPDRRRVHEALAKELERAYRSLQAAEALQLGAGPSPRTPRSGPKAAEALLASALEDKLSQIELRVFLLLAALYPDADMEHIHSGLRDLTGAEAQRRRANAVELLDNLLDRDLKRSFLPLLDDVTRAERVRVATEVLQLSPLGVEEALRVLCRDENGWVRACALWYAAHLELPFVGEPIAAGGSDPNPVVREIALLALAHTSPETIKDVASRYLTDEAPVVRQRAALLFAARAAAG